MTSVRRRQCPGPHAGDRASRVVDRRTTLSRAAPGVAAVAAVLLSALLVPVSAAAQQEAAGADPDTLRSRRSAVLRSLRPGQRVRMDLVGGDRVEGDVLRLADDGLVLDREGAPGAGPGGAGSRPVPTEAVERLWTRSSSWGRGALVGGGVGGVTGAVIGHDFAEFACAETGGDCGLEGALVGAALLGAGGALLGAGAGALIPHWSLRFP